ncbi:phage hypothetical protein [Cyanobacterium sp. HL-69]|uniref:hypothetical protein n=1 Tax=Cyanobacterium sp. HL-69 TaxID=2054282 RepID=UPI000CA3000B|nr:phage hypothetical protein [Cyanobacterium sp. HL-69]
MATVTDLTYEQLNDAAIADPNIGEAVFTFAGDTVSLDIKKLTKDTNAGLTDAGVLEFMYKLRKLAGEAQIAANDAIATTPDEELTSFPNFSFGIPSEEGFVEVTQVATYQIPLGINQVIGTN